MKTQRILQCFNTKASIDKNERKGSIHMGHWEQDGENVNYMARIFFRNRVGTTIVWHQLVCGKVFLAYQGFGTEERQNIKFCVLKNTLGYILIDFFSPKS